MERLAVADGDVQARSVRAGDADLAGCAAGVLADVGQPFLDDAVGVPPERVRHGVCVVYSHLEVDLRPSQPGLIDEAADVGQCRQGEWWRRVVARVTEQP